MLWRVLEGSSEAQLTQLSGQHIENGRVRKSVTIDHFIVSDHTSLISMERSLKVIAEEQFSGLTNRILP